MKFKRFINADGDEVLVTESGWAAAEKAKWEELTVTPYADDEPATEPTAEKPANPPSNPPAEKPLDKMKLTELIEHAEKIGVNVDELDALRKPGASKAKAIEAINAHLAAASA